MIWTDERVGHLKSLYADTHVEWSCSQIAAKLGGGLSRNAVIGKLHRLGLSGRKSGAKPKGNGLSRKITGQGIGSAVQKINAARAAPKIKPEPFVMSCVEVDPLHLTLTDLKDGVCRFPFGDDPATVTYCGHPSLSGRSWCPQHFRVVTVPTPPRRSSYVAPTKLGGVAA